MSDADDCDCTLQGWSRDLNNFGSNTGSDAEFTGYISIGPTDADSYAVGYPTGEFNSARPGRFVIHTDWCCHRPTRAQIQCFSGGTANGTARVFVEAKPDFSTYVYAEMEVVAGLQFPELDLKRHFSDGSTARVASYTPTFGSRDTAGYVFVGRGQDATSYATSPWPLSSPTQLFGVRYQENNRFTAAQMVVRCGYRQNNTDTIIQEFVWPHNVGGVDYLDFSYQVQLGSVGVACHWDDINDRQSDGKVRCGMLLQKDGQAEFLVFGEADFTFPFEVDRSLFEDPTSTSDPKAFDEPRYVGASATASAITVPQRYSTVPGAPVFETGQSAILNAASIAVFVSCAADFADIIADPYETTNFNIVPRRATLKVDEPTSPIGPNSSYFVRRPDITSRAAYSTPAADSWHASRLVMSGSLLAGRHAMHRLHLEFVQDSQTQPVHGTSLFPLSIAWSGGDFGYSDVITNPGTRPQFQAMFQGDFLSGAETPERYAWNGIAGQHTLEPEMGGKRLIPNCWHKFYSSTYVTHQERPAAPSWEVTEKGVGDIGWMRKTNWDALEAIAAPHWTSDYRVDWTLETYPQLWVSVIPWQSAGINVSPLSATLEESGMTSENHDKWSQGNIWRATALSGYLDGKFAELRVTLRLGIKLTIDAIKGYRRVRTQEQVKENVAFNGFQGINKVDPTSTQADFWAPSLNPPWVSGWGFPADIDTVFRVPSYSGVRLHSTQTPGDVACTEYVKEFAIPILGTDMLTLSSGGEVTKQLIAGYNLGQAYYRTVKVRLSKI